MKYFAFLSLLAFGLAACERPQDPQGEQGESITDNQESMMSRLYWTDGETGTIQRANLDGSQVETIVAGLDTPSDIALSP